MTPRLVARALWQHVEAEHWLGAELVISGVAAVTWALIGLFAPLGTLDQSIMRIIGEIGGETFWQCWFLGFGMLHLYGIAVASPWARMTAAFALAWSFSAVFLALATCEPWHLSVALYLGAVLVEIIAVAHHASGIVRRRQLRIWKRGSGG